MFNRKFLNIYAKIGAVTVFTPFLFFALNSIFSIEYSGLSESNSYVYTLIGSWAIFLFFYFRNKLYKSVFLVSDVIFYFLIGFFFLVFLYDFNNEAILNKTTIYQYLLMIVPVALFAIDFGKFDFPDVVFRYFFYLCQVILLSIVFVIPKMLKIDVVNLSTFYGGGHYQGFGYIVSLSFLINLVYLLFFLKSVSLYKKIYFFLSFIIHLSGAIFSGARGSMIVIFLGAIILFYLKFNLKHFFYIILKTVLLLFLSFNLLLFFLADYYDRIIESADRIFSYISDGTIDMSKTSNRDILYEESIKHIKNSPIFGYGFFDYLKQTGFGYPHNLFLEILLQGGIIYLVFWIFFLLLFIYKLILLISNDKKYIVIFPFVIYCFTLLMFSGSYIFEPFFWFSIIFVFTASSKTKLIIRNLN